MQLNSLFQQIMLYRITFFLSVQSKFCFHKYKTKIRSGFRLLLAHRQWLRLLSSSQKFENKLQCREAIIENSDGAANPARQKRVFAKYYLNLTAYRVCLCLFSCQLMRVYINVCLFAVIHSLRNVYNVWYTCLSTFLYPLHNYTRYLYSMARRLHS